ncbi:response regulator transcription factor [Clostridium oceanicum]|uniref:Stage 0 sporulation protein A homolog n=1 Tax=Clostridium oceanicum TaxID=1543 RepID=A0ABN1JKX4_9CLOT
MNVLVAEDEENIRELIKEHLRNEDYNLYFASNGQEALKIMRETEIDLGVFDVIMPYLDGFNLLRKVREKSNMPVIFLTARGEEMDKVLGLGLGADDYIVKPFSFAELKARIQAQLRRNYLYKKQKDESENVLISKDIKLVKDECAAYKGNKQLDLSTKEYLILLLLMENKGKVFTKRQIYDAVWKEDFLFDENTVMVHLSNLRSKLDNKGGSKKYITTIRGIGYKWNKDEEQK